MLEKRTLAATAYLLVLLIASPAAAQDPTGLVAQWSFDEAVGVTTADAGPNDLDGELINGAQFADGVVGNGLRLDGMNDYVSVTDGGAFPAAIGALSQGTISTWFRFDVMPETGEIYPIFYMGDATIPSGTQGPAKLSATLEVGHFFANDAKLYWTTYSGGHTPTMCFDTGFNLNPGQWYHFAVVVDPTGNTGYLNGQELTGRHYNFADASSPEFLEDVPTQEEVWFGRGFLASTPTEEYFPGAIDEVLIYDRLLSGAEIADYYASVPEPAIMSLLALGGSALLRRKKK